MITSKRKTSPIYYSSTGDDYSTKDPAKKLFLTAARATGKNLVKNGFKEISETRGESAYVWRQGNIYMVSVIEGLGTKNLIADEVRKLTGKTYYDVIAHDTVATIINDLVSVGALPLVIHAYWAIESNSWLSDEERMRDLIRGWKKACDIAGVSWGGGETATLKQIVNKNASEFAGSAVGIIKHRRELIVDQKLKAGDRIVFIKSNGINANGSSLARAVAKKVRKGYEERLINGKSYGDSLLTRTNIYAKLVADMQKAKLDIHYISNITGHGLRKVMRSRRPFSYVIEKLFKPQEIFNFIQRYAGIDDYQMYKTYNMGQDYAIFVPLTDLDRCLKIIRANKFQAINAGYVEPGPRRVVIKPKNLVYEGSTLDLR